MLYRCKPCIHVILSVRNSSIPTESEKDGEQKRSHFAAVDLQSKVNPLRPWWGNPISRNRIRHAQKASPIGGWTTGNSFVSVRGLFPHQHQEAA